MAIKMERDQLLSIQLVWMNYVTMHSWNYADSEYVSYQIISDLSLSVTTNKFTHSLTNVLTFSFVYYYRYHNIICINAHDKQNLWGETSILVFSPLQILWVPLPCPTGLTPVVGVVTGKLIQDWPTFSERKVLFWRCTQITSEILSRWFHCLMTHAVETRTLIRSLPTLRYETEVVNFCFVWFLVHLWRCCVLRPVSELGDSFHAVTPSCYVTG